MVIRIALALCLLSTAAHAQSVVIADGASEIAGSGAELVMTQAGVLVQAGGVFTLVGNDVSNRAYFSGPASDKVYIDVLSGGTIDVRYAKFTNLTTLTVASGGKILRLHDTVFQDLVGLNPVDKTPWIDLSALGSGDRQNIPASFNLVSFYDPQPTPNRRNVRAGANTPGLAMLGDGTNDGDRWGASYEDDIFNRITWGVNAVKRYLGTTFEAAFPTIHAALSDPGTTDGKRLKVELGSMIFIDESIDWNNAAYGGRPTSAGPAVELAHVAPMSGLAFSNSAAGQKGVLIRSAVARGGIDGTTAKNCTVYDPSASVVSVSDVVGVNCLIECDYTGTNNTFTTSLHTAHSSYFRGAASYDLRLATPGGLDAVDEGSSQSYTENTDADGEAYGFDGKPAGFGTWDIGADEMISVASPALGVDSRTKTSITWSIGTVANELGFHFYFGSHAGAEPASTTLPADTITYLESNLTENQVVTRHVHGYTPAGDWGASINLAAYAAVRNAIAADFSLTPGTSNVLVNVIPPPNAASGQTGVQIERSPDGSTGWTVVQAYAATYVFTDTGLAAQTWYYRITFRNGDGVAAQVSPNQQVTVGGTLVAPAITTPTKKSNDNTPQIAGTHPVDGTIIEVWVGGTSVGTTTVSGGSWSIHNTGLPFAEAAYSVQARAKNGTLYSDASNTITFTVDTTPPDPPIGIAIVQLNGRLVVHWKASSASDLRGYNVYRSTSPGGPWGNPINGVSTPVRKDQTRYCDTVTNGTYYYKVTAVDDALNEAH